MSKRPAGGILPYATPEPYRGDGNLGALPALACLVIALVGLVAIVIGAGVVVTFYGSSSRTPMDYAAQAIGFASMLVGALAFWITTRISRRYRR